MHYLFDLCRQRYTLINSPFIIESNSFKPKVTTTICQELFFIMHKICKMGFTIAFVSSSVTVLSLLAVADAEENWKNRYEQLYKYTLVT